MIFDKLGSGLEMRGCRMDWILIEDDLPRDGERVVGMRNDGWWAECVYSIAFGGWLSDGYRQDIVKWIRIAK